MGQEGDQGGCTRPSQLLLGEAAVVIMPEGRAAAALPARDRQWRCLGASPACVLAAGSLVLALSMGTRHVFGVFLEPISEVGERGLTAVGDQ